MHTAYTLTVDDVYQFQRHFYSIRQRHAYLMFRWGFAAICFIFALMMFGGRPGFENRLMLAMFCAGGVILLIFMPAIWRWALRNHARRFARVTPGFGKPNQFSLTPDGFTVTSAVGESHVKWTGIVEITETDDLLCLWCSKLFAVIVPKRALSDESDAIARIRQNFVKAIGDGATRSVLDA